MATPYKIHLTVNDTGIVNNKPPTAESAAKVSELLQVNHENQHVYYDGVRKHNHIVHHLLTLYSLGASVAEIEKQYDGNISYQHPIGDLDEKVVSEMADPDAFKDYVGRPEHYRNFLVYWQREMESKGWESIVNDNIFARTERADDLLARFFSGLHHPLIHLGFGIEFNQPAIVAEALASAAVHDAWPGILLKGAEKVAQPSGKTLPQILDEIRADNKLAESVDPGQNNKLRDGTLIKAADEMIKYVSQWTVEENELHKKTAEMINAVVYFTAAAQNPPKQIVFDFYFIHCVNLSIFFSTFNAQSWLSTSNKCRLLEWKTRLDLGLYAAQRSPVLLLEEIATYTPNKLEAGDAEWKGIFQRLFVFPEDGHAVKFARAVANGEIVCKEYEGETWARVKGFMWEKVGNMILDSAEETNANWARSVGFPEVWEQYKDQPRSIRL